MYINPSISDKFAHLGNTHPRNAFPFHRQLSKPYIMDAEEYVP